MTRTMYLFRLRELLAAMPAADREEVLADINEHFDSALQQGETEQEIIARLGTPESIAVQYGYTDAVNPPTVAPPPVSASKKNSVGADRICGCIGFGFFNICLGYPLVFTFIAVVFALVVSAIAIGLTGALYLILTLISPLVPLAQDSLINGFPFAANLFALCAMMTSYWAVGGSMLTNIVDETTYLICDGEGADRLVEKAYHIHKENDYHVLKGVVSRKKQLIPMFMSALQDQ